MKKQVLYTAPPLLLVLFLLGIMACRKDEPLQDCPPDLPCATQYGANTFGCYIDGVPWVAGVAPYVFDPTLRQIDAIYDELEYGQTHFNELQITSRKVDSLRYDFWKITFSPLVDSGRLDHKLMSSFRVDLRLKKDFGYKEYQIDTLSQYNIEILKLDKLKKNISCLFECRLVSHDKGDTLNITNGRFDVKYSPE